MGFFSLNRRASKAESTDVARTSKPSRLSVIVGLASKEPAAHSERRSSAPATPLKRSKSLTVMVNPTPEQGSAVPCRYVATSTKLGSGAYGAVLLGHDVCMQSQVAIKFIPEGRMRTSSLEREVSMLERLSEAKHPALLKFHGRLRPDDVKAGEIRADGVLPLPKPHTSCHALVMERVHGGELFDHVVKCEGLNEPVAAPLFAQLCDAVHAAHALGIAHRDLKLENVLLVCKKVESASPRRGARAAAGGSIKLIDWGLAHQHAFAPDGTIIPEMLHSRCGSRSYMAPEVTNRDISGTVGYDGFAADVWSLGVCLFAIHMAFFPFEQANPELDWRARRVVEAQRAGKSTMQTILSFYPQKLPNGGLSDGLIALLDRMLVFNPKKRATLTEVLCSEWLAPHVPAECFHATVAHTLSISRLATRSARSTSSSEYSAGATPRDEFGASMPASRVASRDELRSSRLERLDSTGTRVSDASSCASSAHAPPLAHSVALGTQSSGVPSHARRSSAPARAMHLSPPPASPMSPMNKASDELRVVVAGASSHREGQSTPKREKEAAELASLLSKACKVSNLGSPRHPDRQPLDFVV